MRVQDSRFRVHGREFRVVGLGSATAREVDNFQEFDDFYRMKEPGSVSEPGSRCVVARQL